MFFVCRRFIDVSLMCPSSKKIQKPKQTVIKPKKLSCKSAKIKNPKVFKTTKQNLRGAEKFAAQKNLHKQVLYSIIEWIMRQCMQKYRHRALHC